MNLNRRYMLAAVIIVALIVAAYAGLKEGTGASTEGGDSGPILAGEEVSRLLTAMNFFQLNEQEKSPEFSLISVEGDQVRLRQYRGKVVLLNFWATW